MHVKKSAKTYEVEVAEREVAGSAVEGWVSSLQARP
jgi:hypothetical protein